MRFERTHFEEEETIITFLCGKRHLDAAKHAVHTVRHQLKRHIRRCPDFKNALTPIRPETSMPAVIRRMCTASQKVGVGPMAAVAGAVALVSLKAILDHGADEAVVDNGGDIACFIRHPLTVGIFSGLDHRGDFALELPPQDRIQGVCTSSGTIGPSRSFGTCDAAVVLSDDILLADAAATALGNRIRSEGSG